MKQRKNNYHDATVLDYQWKENDLILNIKPCGCKDHQCPSQVQILSVRNKEEIDRILAEMVEQPPSNKSIYNIDKTDKKEYTVHTSPALRIECKGLLEI